MKRFIAADLIFPVSSEPLRDGLIVADENGSVLEIGKITALSVPEEKIEHFTGIVCPGFINTHCHLELSHLKGHITQNKGMTGFISELLGKRPDFSEEEIQQGIVKAEEEMFRNGIVAVADISNTNHSFHRKTKGKLWYHTFIEIFSMDPGKARETFENGKKLAEQLSDSKLSHSIIPHAPYTMSLELLNLINEEAKLKKSIISIHNQESLGEGELFISNSGGMYEAFCKMGIKKELMRMTGKNSLHSTLPHIKDAAKILLVHNTYTTEEDIVWANSALRSAALSLSKGPLSAMFWCTCPNANIYIENKLPDYKAFIKNNAKITIGTDSLASNHHLSVLEEMKTISKHFPEISLQTLLTWATKNGACFLGKDDLGTIEKGKRPGLNLLKGMNDLGMTDQTVVERIL